MFLLFVVIIVVAVVVAVVIVNVVVVVIRLFADVRFLCVIGVPLRFVLCVCASWFVRCCCLLYVCMVLLCLLPGCLC